MRKITTTVYKFEELTPEAQEVAISSMTNINIVGGEWSKKISEEVNRIGFMDHFKNGFSVAKDIIDYHAAGSETEVLARKYLNDPDYRSIDFRSDLCWHYDELARIEREFLTSRDNILKSITDSTLEFTAAGNRWGIENHSNSAENE